MSDHALDWPAIRDAARRLERGELVAFPTETVYGLGADAENPHAVADIYEAKGRPSTHPVIVHIPTGAEIGYWAQTVPDEARKLMAAFWPGPLTLIFKRAENIPAAVSGGQDSIGIRCPSHPVAQALLQTFRQGRGGIAAPSANKFGHVSPTTAQHVRDEFGTGDTLVQCVLDGGASEVGIESTIIDLSRGQAVLLRPGHISSDDIAAVLGHAPLMPDAEAPRASGTLESHYAPRTPVVLVDSAQLPPILAALRASGSRVALMHYQDGDLAADATYRLSAQASLYARHLYGALRALDRTHADVIVVETPPAGAAWNGVNDRLRRAAHDSVGILSRLPPR
jgi:L-threonylcarbamoyladenylate synthase